MTTSVLEYSPPIRLFRRRSVRRVIVALGLVALLIPAVYIGAGRWRKYQAEKEARRLAAPSELVAAAYSGDVVKAKQALADGAVPSALDQGWCGERRNALTIAVLARQMDVVRVLIQAGGDPNQRFADSKSLLAHATICKDVELVKLLLGSGADPNCDNGSSVTPVKMAGYLGVSEILALLLEAGADVNDAAVDGGTLLHKLAWRGSDADIELALKHGAKVNEVDLAGRTPLDFAFREENRVVLKRAGGVVGTGINAEAD